MFSDSLPIASLALPVVEVRESEAKLGDLDSESGGTVVGSPENLDKWVLPAVRFEGDFQEHLSDCLVSGY